MFLKASPTAQRKLMLAGKTAAPAARTPLRIVIAGAVCLTTFAPLSAHAGQLRAFKDMLRQKAIVKAEEAFDHELRRQKPDPRDLPAAEGGDAAAERPPEASRKKAILAPTKGWELVGTTNARLVNELGESYVVTRVPNGYRFELTIPHAKPGELNEWSPNFQIEGMPATHVTFDHVIPLGYTATACRGRNLPDADACAASRQGKVDDHTIIQWVPTLREMPKLKDIFELLAQGKPIEVDYILLSVRKVARFPTQGGADVRKILTH